MTRMRRESDMQVNRLLFFASLMIVFSLFGCQDNSTESNQSSPNSTKSIVLDSGLSTQQLPYSTVPQNTHVEEPLPNLSVNSVAALENICCNPSNFVNQTIKVRSARMLSQFIAINPNVKFNPMYFLYGYTKTGADLFGFPVDGSSTFQCRRFRFIVDSQDSALIKSELEKRDSGGTREVFCDLSFQLHDFKKIDETIDHVGKLVWIRFHDAVKDNQNQVTYNNTPDSFYRQQGTTTYQTYQYSQRSTQYYRPSDYNIQNPPAVDWRDPIYWNGWPVFRGPEPIFIGP